MAVSPPPHDLSRPIPSLIAPVTFSNPKMRAHSLTAELVHEREGVVHGAHLRLVHLVPSKVEPVEVEMVLKVDLVYEVRQVGLVGDYPDDLELWPALLSLDVHLEYLRRTINGAQGYSRDTQG